MKADDAPKSQLRKHYFLDQYVVVAPKRNLRPDSFASKGAGHKLETPTSPAIEKDPGIMTVPGKDGWAVKVIDNAFPALSPDNPEAYGKQEVVVETPEHNVEFSELSIEQILKVFAAYRERLDKLSQMDGVRYVSVFKNDGPAAGASIAHAHSQIVALPLIPPGLMEEAEGYEDYLNEIGRCPYCDLIEWERAQDVRVIYEDKSVMAVAPYASTYAFEVWIVPKDHVDQFGKLNLTVSKSVATVLKNITAKLDSVKISYNFFLQNSLPGNDHHFVLKIKPRPNVWAGLELSTAVIINAVSPEFATLWYKGKA